ncbi:hypothetical protein Y032_0015g2774 [Ancylostoma ceylanicum]|uniref:Uncharacterized protein n=1 Tax=Ancylostoma ceylanicum TaxID=53326 RepID=A0A016V8R5_9BILA|nr:hypothetical protein Y032_0015g2774 [Ancylostoma ceylanicum]
MSAQEQLDHSLLQYAYLLHCSASTPVGHRVSSSLLEMIDEFELCMKVKNLPPEEFKKIHPEVKGVVGCMQLATLDSVPGICRSALCGEFCPFSVLMQQLLD